MAVAAAWCQVSASHIREDAPASESQRAAAERNDRIDTRNHAALGLSIGAAVALSTGVLLLLWPSHSAGTFDLNVAAAPSTAEITARWWF